MQDPEVASSSGESNLDVGDELQPVDQTHVTNSLINKSIISMT